MSQSELKGLSKFISQATSDKNSLADLAKDPNPYVREAAARNLSTPREALKMLAKDHDQRVRDAAALALLW